MGKVWALGGDLLQRFKESGRIFIVLPALIPDDQRWFGSGRRLVGRPLKIDADGQHFAFGFYLGDGVQFIAITF